MVALDYRIVRTVGACRYLYGLKVPRLSAVNYLQGNNQPLRPVTKSRPHFQILSLFTNTISSHPLLAFSLLIITASF